MQGRWGGHQWRGGRGVQPGQIARLVEPCLLALLRREPRHGYELISAMAHFGLDPQLIDSALVYRSLRQMEADGWVGSDWETSGGGPPRRRYTLAPAGREALAQWREELGRTHDLLHKLLDDMGEG